MIQRVCRTPRWNENDSQGDRVDVECPLDGAQYTVGFDLPDMPAGGHPCDAL